MKSLIYTDPHICKDNILELKSIFLEIMSFDADRVICLGDYYDRRTLHSEELIFGTSIMKQFVDRYKEVIMLEGNHDKETIKYIRDLGVKVVDNIVIDNNYYGHFFVEESSRSFNSAKMSLKDLEKYNYVFLGHQHTFQNLGDKRYHPGSVIWVDFGEVKDTRKTIFILEDNKLNIVGLKTPIPMVDVFNKEEIEKLDVNTKVRYVIKDFNQLKNETNELDKYKDRFFQFKIKLDFESDPREVEILPRKSVTDIINTWLDSIEDKEVQEELRLTFSEDN